MESTAVVRIYDSLRSAWNVRPRLSQLRKLAVLLDMDDGLERLLELAADTETLQDSLAEVDLSVADDDNDGKDALRGDEEDAAAATAVASKEGTSCTSTSRSAASVLMSPSAAAAVKTRAKETPAFRNTSWDKEDVGNTSEDATEVKPTSDSALFVGGLSHHR